MIDAIHHTVYVSASNVGRYQLPTADNANLPHSLQYAARRPPVERIRSMQHVIPRMALQSS